MLRVREPRVEGRPALQGLAETKLEIDEAGVILSSAREVRSRVG